MLRVMLPTTITPRRLIRWAVTVADVLSVAVTNVLSVAVVNEVIVVIDVDVIISTTPSATITPTTTPSRTHGYTYAKRNRHAGWVISWRGIGDWRLWIDRRSVYDDWIVGWDVNNLRVGLFNYDHLFVFDNGSFDLLLFGRLQIPCISCLFPHALHGIHDVILLRKKCIS